VGPVVGLDWIDYGSGHVEWLTQVSTLLTTCLE